MLPLTGHGCLDSNLSHPDCDAGPLHAGHSYVGMALCAAGDVVLELIVAVIVGCAVALVVTAS